MIRPIRIYGDQVLHQRAVEVVNFDQELADLVQDMYETMDAAPGVGLAAPQIGVGLRVFVYSYPDEEDNPRRGVVINPVLTHSAVENLEPDEETDSEGCLSFPGERFPVCRGTKVTLEGVDLEQKPIRIEAEGWFARIFQHEYDHLDGIIYVDKLNFNLRKNAFEVMQERGWNKPGCSWLPGKDHLED
ncbi:MAG: peptide deformylase [Actinomycetota bacterium]